MIHVLIEFVISMKPVRLIIVSLNETYTENR
jgi:hypothetical protein